jgi:REP element-mobilizing transposase RayT
MPRPNSCWRHIVINTHSSWLHGDKRGFRSRKHRIHSSGDYKSPPPKFEHAGLRVYQQQRSDDEIQIPYEIRPIVGRAIAEHLKQSNYRLLAVAVAVVHTHFLVELPDFIPKIKSIVGEAKRKSSRAVKNWLPGAVWSAGGTFKRVESRNRLRTVHDYILFEQGPGAWTWSYRDKDLKGMFRRKRPSK